MLNMTLIPVKLNLCFRICFNRLILKQSVYKGEKGLLIRNEFFLKILQGQ